ncbi:riboflavin biosynthesis protein RibF [Limosilactobacillus ingluviei]|uniref:Riboflavin biosynthesis protein n=1 Tax=Limosilactobacillus ingluviei TaxID=148604 RepID=A0A0R2GWY1_9LACO|nr:riboflavin biosynthesis protein RibF [Limosilactobacillus ingluviei]KRN45347.1 riboflavin biosynthesis protein [Limosilactobacillus ingluviei]
MEVYRIHHPLQTDQLPAGPVVLAMGFFDGVHRGHQAVIQRAQVEARQRNLPLAVLTYDKLPGIVYSAFPAGVHYLTTPERKLELLAQQEVDRVYLVDFTARFGALSPQAFVDQYLVAMGAVVVVAGFDHTYGPKDVATMARLPFYAAGRFKVIEVTEQSAGAEKISSTRIRHLIDEGQVQAANALLGYHYQTTGIVVHGFARGRTLGFPTANVAWDPAERLPSVGVYAVRFWVDGHWYPGMASVGYNVTFGEHNQKTIEVYLFDFAANIYGEHVKVEWVQRLRGEEKFADVAGLVAQLHADERAARQILA